MNTCYLIVVITQIYLQVSSDQEKVLLVSLDGMRWDFNNMGITPNIDWIQQNGVTADVVRNVFPTNTIPNHQSIVTGLYPEHHGMINNMFPDTETGETFQIEINGSKWWKNADPIWIDNELQGHKSGVCYWPGFNVEFNGKLATYSTSGNTKYGIPFTSEKMYMPFDERLQLVKEWLEKDDVTFVALYYEQLDSCFHQYGPDSKNGSTHEEIVSQCRLAIDKSVGSIRKMVDNITEKVNVIITGDHGHSNLKSTRVVWLEDYIDIYAYSKLVIGYTSVFIYTLTGQKQFVYKKLKGIKNSHFQVYLKESIPNFYHLKHNVNAPDILIVGDEGWTIANRKEKPWFIKENEPKWEVGEHGYSQFVRNMNPGFYAYGPSFKKSFKIPFMETIDLYSLMCSILKIKPRPNDGNFHRISKLLQKLDKSVKRGVL